MVIVVPEPKRLANLAKHGLDMAACEAHFPWDDFLRLPAKPSRTGRVRWRYVGRMRERILTMVVSPLGGEALAIVSLRPASQQERDAYDARD